MKFKKWICALLALMLLMGTALAAGSELGEYASRVVSETNADRLKNGLDALRVDPALTAAARIRAQEITQKYSHTRPDGTRWATVSSAAYGEHIARFPVNGDDRGLVEHHALPLAIDHDAGRAQIDANIQNRCHETKSPLCGIDS